MVFKVNRTLLDCKALRNRAVKARRIKNPDGGDIFFNKLSMVGMPVQKILVKYSKFVLRLLSIALPRTTE